jgi:DNA-binding response OmpR family regulator
LVVEDEPMVLSWVVEVLQDAGYEVVAYTDPRTALQHFREQHDGIGLVLSDVVMPGMSGWTLAREIRRLREDTQVLYMSGYSEDRLSEVEDPDAGACLLQKPLKADELLDAVRVAVDGTPR